MLQSFARMLSELLRHSDRIDVFERMRNGGNNGAISLRALQRGLCPPTDAPPESILTELPSHASTMRAEEAREAMMLERARRAMRERAEREEEQSGVRNAKGGG